MYVSISILILLCVLSVYAAKYISDNYFVDYMSACVAAIVAAVVIILLTPAGARSEELEQTVDCSTFLRGYKVVLARDKDGFFAISGDEKIIVVASHFFMMRVITGDDGVVVQKLVCGRES